ncbi:MAG: hypothetical protein HYV60_13525 [Planctomycetia bacterium]|nr:hypothetical protein [Planctomycetia bacterium]
MGVTIHYRGTMDDVTLVEEMEDRVVDLALALGGRATVWRSFADDDPSRAIRGLMLEMAPGQDTMSLLVSPEGHLISLFEIEEAEKQPLAEPPYCFVKTQFGSPQGHIAIVYLLDALKSRYFSNLNVNDESGFYEHRDPRILSQKIKQLGDAIRSLGEGLQKYGLSDEAAEDPDILVARVERVARLVAEKMRSGPSKEDDDPVNEEDDAWNEPTFEEEVEAMDRLHRRNQRRSERMTRRIADATAAGMSIQEAFELAMRDEGLEPPHTSDQQDDDGENVHRDQGFVDFALDSSHPPEPWRASLEAHPFDAPSDHEIRVKHPTVERAEKLLTEIMSLDGQATQINSFANTATRGLIDVVGGLVQATHGERGDRIERALTIVQLKRALKGHAFCRGAIFGLRGTDQIDQATSDSFHDELAAILESIHDLLAAAWDDNDSL